MSIIQKSQKALEYDKVLLKLAGYAKTAQSIKLCRELAPFELKEDIQNSLNLTKEAKSLPVTEEAVKDSLFQSENWKPFTDALYTAAKRPGSAEYPTVEQEIANMYMKVVMGSATIEEAMNKGHKKVQETLDELFENY